jgi:hypothetical protein
LGVRKHKRRGISRGVFAFGMALHKKVIFQSALSGLAEKDFWQSLGNMIYLKPLN